MTKNYPRLIALAMIAGSIACLTGCCTFCKHQLMIVTQPEDQTVPIGENATFTIGAVKGPPLTTNGITYQWQENHTPDISLSSTNWTDISGATVSSYTVPNVQLTNVGFYRVMVSGSGPISSDVASLSMIDSGGGGGGLPPVFGAPKSAPGTSGPCPGPYAGSVSYTKTVANGWGWTPMAGVAPYVAADGTMRTDTKVQMSGSAHPGPCSNTPVSATTLQDAKYRFTIFFPNNVPATNAYPIQLTNFLP
jgi:hypothetical protein